MAKWELNRFLNTITYFDAFPVITQLQRWLTGEANLEAQTGERILGRILVVGATSEVGQLIVKQLLKTGYQVRAIVSNLDPDRDCLGSEVEIVTANLANPLTLTTAVMGAIGGVIYISDPQVASGESSLTNLINAAADHLPVPTERMIFDFTQATGDLRAMWGAVDDVVMGGISESSVRLIDDYALFSGNVSTENSGGFASVRTRNFSQPLNLSNYQGIKLKVKGDGQRYKLFVRTETAWDGLGYAYSFDTSSYDWRIVEIPFKDLVPVFRAKTVNNAPIVDRSQIRSLQIMLSKFEYDSKLNPYFNPGLFSLQIQSIQAYGGQPTPQFILMDGEGMNDGERVLQASKLPYTIVRSAHLDAPTAAMIAVKAIHQPEVVGQVLGH
jgi:hypothetical protein